MKDLLQKLDTKTAIVLLLVFGSGSGVGFFVPLRPADLVAQVEANSAKIQTVEGNVAAVTRSLDSLTAALDRYVEANERRDAALSERVDTLIFAISERK